MNSPLVGDDKRSPNGCHATQAGKSEHAVFWQILIAGWIAVSLCHRTGCARAIVEPGHHGSEPSQRVDRDR